MIAGRYESRCLPHAVNVHAANHAASGIYLDALRALPGQLSMDAA